MVSSKIFKKDNGDRYEIKVSLSTESHSSTFYWDVVVLFCLKGKRTFKHLNCQDDWEYRALDMDERRKYYMKFILSHIPVEWILEVQQKILSELSKPIMMNNYQKRE